MMEREKETEQKLLEVIDGISPKEEGGWVNLTKVTVPLREAGVEVPKHSLRKIIENFARSPEYPDGVVELCKKQLNAVEVYYVRRAANDLSEEKTERVRKTAETTEQTALLAALDGAGEKDPEGWLDLAELGKLLVKAGVNYRNYGCAKLRPFVERYVKTETNPQGVLELKECRPAPEKPVVCYVRRAGEAAHFWVSAAESKVERGPREPQIGMHLSDWAHIPDKKYRKLADMALEEKWYYSEKDAERLPLLRNYLKYTFKRLCFESKILIEEDRSAKGSGDEYAVFNTGLVDRTYQSIYALFRNNTRPGKSARPEKSPYWYLLDFVVEGVDAGKTLTRIFAKEPQRADYFENKAENMLYRTDKKLDIDYPHILLENTSRLPKELLKQVCKATGREDLLEINKIGIDDVRQEDYCRNLPEEPTPAQKKCKEYYDELGRRLKKDAEEGGQTYGFLQERIKRALDITKKRVEWNYKTAIPVYYPTANRGALLLPLALVQQNHVDLALVVEWQPQSERYQGETILPLNIAYSNSRLITRPDSDWLRMDQITAGDAEEDADEDE